MHCADEQCCCTKLILPCCVQTDKAADIDDIFQKGKGSQAKAGFLALGGVPCQQPNMQSCPLNADVCSS